MVTFIVITLQTVQEGSEETTARSKFIFVITFIVITHTIYDLKIKKYTTIHKRSAFCCTL